MNKKSLAEVALLTESEAAKMFRMGTTRFKARYVSPGAPDAPTHRRTRRRVRTREELRRVATLFTALNIFEQ
jgi:hypothetical protein